MPQPVSLYYYYYNCYYYTYRAAYGMAFHVVNLFIYLLFLASLTAFVSYYSTIMDSLAANRALALIHTTVVKNATYVSYANDTNCTTNNVSKPATKEVPTYTGKIQVRYKLHVTPFECPLDLYKRR